MSVKYVAAVEALARSLSEMLVPEPAAEDVLCHQPLVSANVTLVRLGQPQNALLPMLVTLEAIVMLVRLRQPLNAYSLMLVH